MRCLCRCLVPWVVVFAVLANAMAVAAENDAPRAGREHVVFSTDFGDMLFTLYPDVAPRHCEQILRLVKLGAYDGTHFFRVIPNFIVQVSEITDRLEPLTPRQQDALKPIKGEFSQTLKHKKGTLSMARWEDDPDSASSSFSILLHSAPHLDGKYTIFGELESGATVINKILAQPRQGSTPEQRITVNKAYTVTDLAAYYSDRSYDPAKNIGEPLHKEDLASATGSLKNEAVLQLISIMMAAIIVVSLLGFVLYNRISKSRLLSLLLVNVLICGFVLFIILVPMGHSNTWIAAMVFIGLFALFRLMSRFESKQ